jgi:Transposase DDE domain
LGGDRTGPSPVDRARSASKHHLIACGCGTPLAASLTGRNCNDITRMIPLVDAIPPVRGRRGRPRRRPKRLYGDRAYHSRNAAASYAAVTSRRRSPGRRGRTDPGSASSAGSSSARSPGYTNTGASASATNDAPTSTKPSSIGCSLICLKLLQTEESF